MKIRRRSLLSEIAKGVCSAGRCTTFWMALLLLSGLGTGSAVAGLLNIGDPAPNFLLRASTGAEYDLYQHLDGRRVLVSFLSVPCKACDDSLPAMRKLCRLSEPHGIDLVRVVILVADSMGEGDKAADLGCSFPALADRFSDGRYVTAEAFGVMGTPVFYLIDSQRRVVWRHVGRMVWEKIEPSLLKALSP